MNQHLKDRGVWHELKSYPPEISVAAKPNKIELVVGWGVDAFLMLHHGANVVKSKLTP
jgi:hypothetical protein